VSTLRLDTKAHVEEVITGTNLPSQGKELYPNE
jgi:hypothetical protein